MRSWMIAGIAGLILPSLGTNLLPSDTLLLSAAALLMALLLLPRLRTAVCLLMIFWAGFSWATYYGYQLRAQILPHTIENIDLKVHGRLVGLPKSSPTSTQFDFYVDQATLANSAEALPWQGKVKLSWYGPEPLLAPQKCLSLMVRLKRPHGFANPGGQDYERWLITQGFGAKGYVRNFVRMPCDSDMSIWQEYTFAVLQMRLRLQQQILQLTQLRFGYTMVALLLGQRNFSASQQTLLQDTGTAHLFAISGLHVGMVAFCIYQSVFWLWARLSCYVALNVTAPCVAASCAIFAGFAYSVLAGFNLPCQRALIMLLVFLLEPLCGIYRSGLYRMTMALLLVLLLDPLAWLGVGFWLSFIAVGTLLYIAQGQAKPLPGQPGTTENDVPLWRRLVTNSALTSLLKTQLCITVALAPMMIFGFGKLPLLGVVVNLVAIPWVSFVVVPLSIVLLLATSLGGFVFQMIAQLLDIAIAALWWLLQQMNALGSASLLLPTGQPHYLIVLLLIGLLLLAPVAAHLRWRIVLLLPLLFIRPAPVIAYGEFAVHILDVGQGTAVVVRTRNKVLVYDSGPRLGDHYDAAQAVVAPFLQQFHISVIDNLVISHEDNDHSGGADYLLANFTVAQVQRQHRNPCLQGQSWQWDGVDFNVLHPEYRYKKRNNNSCVIRVSNAKTSVMLAGDIEAKAEYDLLRSQQNLAVDGLLVPHHGSKTSSTTAWLAQVRPRWAVYSAGYLNRFGHPHNQVQQRYLQSEVATLNTAEHGAISFQSWLPVEQRLQAFRRRYKAYWRVQNMVE